MPTPIRVVLMLVCLLLCLLTVLAQDERDPVALLMREAEGAAYSIIVRTNAKLPVGSRLSAIISNKNTLVSWQEEVGDCVAQEWGKFCKRLDGAGNIELYFSLAKAPQASDKFRVIFAVTDGTGKGSFRTLDVLPDAKASGPRTDGDCPDGLIVDVKPDNEWRTDAEAEYYRLRIKALDAWLKANRSAPQGMAKVRIEILTKSGAPEYVVQSFSVSPAVGSGINAQDVDVDVALSARRVSLCLQFAKKLPNEKFNAEIVFKNNPPMELERKLAKTLSGSKAMGSPTASTIPQEKELNLRSFENNFNLGLLYTSSVRDARRGNRTVRERQSRAALDLRFAPLLRGRMKQPEVRKWMPFWTPIFLDAKVSTGRIADDSLSLNRILIGSEVAFRYYQSTQQGHRNKYFLTLRGVNASDRDYKRAEIRGEVEFRPIFDAINKPLRFGRTSKKSILLEDGPQIEIAATGFGYQIEPFIGLEVGNIYRANRAALKGEEKGDMLRRLRFGADLSFSFGNRIILTLGDIFYFRGGVTGGRTRNYFNGEVEVPLANLSRNTAQSIFLSFERGDQPPFSTPSVNALKFGYRVRSDFFAGGAAR